MRNLEPILRKRLEGADRVAVLGVGSTLRGDDAAGVIAARRLARTTRNTPLSARMRVFIGHTVPENLTGEIRTFQPTHLIVLDAAHVGLEPGRCALIDPDAPDASLSASTHSLPLNVLVDYMRRTLGCDVIVIGIQPRSLELGKRPCAAVRKAAAELAAMLESAMQHPG